MGSHKEHVDAVCAVKMKNLDKEFIEERAEVYVKAIFNKSGALENVSDYIGDTVFGIYRLKENIMQDVLYHRQKHRQALKLLTHQMT